MNIKIGNTKLIYSPERTYDDFMIISEVIDSTMSYEYPVLVHNKEELDIWFGTEFPYRDFYISLLGSGVTLYLYKPTLTFGDINQNDYIDLSSFVEEKVDDTDIFYVDAEVVEEGYFTIDEGDGEENIESKSSFFKKLPESNELEEGVIYRIVDNQGNYQIGSNEIKIRYRRAICLRDEYSVELEKYLEDVRNLPQFNSKIDSYSNNNRDSLRLYYRNGKFNHTYLSQLGSGRALNEELSISGLDKNRILDEIDVDKVKDGYQALVFSVDWPVEDLVDNNYVIFPKLNGNGSDIINKLYYKNPTGINTAYYEENKELPNTYYDSKLKVESISNIKSDLNTECRVFGPEDGEEDTDNTWYFYYGLPVNIFNFTNIESFRISTDKLSTYDILTDLTEEFKILDFKSKTIGTAQSLTNDSSIKVAIEYIGDDFYRITISRFSYKEIYEGSFKETGFTERLDYIINKYSKLVYCEFNKKYFDEINEGAEKEILLPEGTWELSGAYIEINTPEMFVKSAGRIFYKETIRFDYFLIPDINNYVTENNYEQIYKSFLNAASNYNKDCQIVIQNFEDDVKYNYTEDPENRLLYFYKPLVLNRKTLLRSGDYLPSYFPYINGIISNIFSVSTTGLLYLSPLNASIKDVYDIDESWDSEFIPNDNTEEDKITLAELKEYKSNYLSDNGHFYYYNQFFNGDNSITSGFMRFVLSKTARELEKNKWSFLGLPTSSADIIKNIESIVERVRINFNKIIRDLRVTGYRLDELNNLIIIRLDTTISDIINNHVSLDITINTNREVWQQ